MNDTDEIVLDDPSTSEQSDKSPSTVTPVVSEPETDKLLMEKLQKLNITNLELQANKDELENKVGELERIQTELKCRLERSQQQIDSAKKELQSMVMKYATSEREVLNLKKHLTDSDKKFKESLKEREQLQSRIKDLTNEKKHLISSVERHVLEAANLSSELELTKNRLEQSNIREEKLQLELQNLSTEYEALKDKIETIESGIAKLPKISVSSTKYSLDEDDDNDDDDDDENVEENIEKNDEENNENNETGVVRKDSPIIKSPSSAKNALSESETDYTTVFQQVLQTNERLLKEKNFYHQTNSELVGRIEELGNRLAEAATKSDDYERKIRLIDELKAELIRKQQVVDSLKEKFDQINSINRSLVGDIDTSKNKESELLDYTERLTAKLVSLQSGTNELKAQLQQYQNNYETLKTEHESLLDSNVQLQSELESCRQEYRTKFEQSVSEHEAITIENLNLKRKVQELENDIAIAKKKHFSALKEMSIEIQKLRKSNVQNHNDLATSSSLSSRTGSISSLNNEQASINHHIPAATPSTTVFPSECTADTLENGHESGQQSEHHSVSDILPASCDTTVAAAGAVNANQEIITSLSQIKKSVLIEKLLKLQRILVKRKEKIDFLEEHCEQLTQQVRNKTKLLQNYILKEETGTLATDSMDQNKAYLSKRGGGIMSSLYNSFSTDDSMTLERSLEINAKLHALLEDTLLKNMTLKENLNTLASEIDKLSSTK